MLNAKIKKKLDSLINLPTVPTVIAEVLEAANNTELSAKSLASIIEKDQALTAKTLRVANSPFYGFSRRIATIDLAIVLLGLNTIKEISLTMALKKFFAKTDKRLFDPSSFWNYSVFCGAASKYLARKFDYRLAGEAFVAGLMHDIGVLIIIQYFPKEFIKIREYQRKNNSSMLEAENQILDSNHTEIGAWLAERWRLPEKLCDAIRDHHNPFKIDNLLGDDLDLDEKGIAINGIEKPLTAIVSAGERFAETLGYKNWAMESVSPELYYNEDLLELIVTDSFLNKESLVEKIKVDLGVEYEKAIKSHQY